MEKYGKLCFIRKILIFDKMLEYKYYHKNIKYVTDIIIEMLV